MKFYVIGNDEKHNYFSLFLDAARYAKTQATSVHASRVWEHMGEGTHVAAIVWPEGTKNPPAGLGSPVVVW